MEIVAHFPWWVGVILAALFYLILHSYSNATAATGILAGFAQYMLPLVCLVGAAVSAIRAHQRWALLHNVAKGDGPRPLQEMTWQQFELVIGQWFRQQGYTVSERGGAGPDGGIDLVVKKDNETFFVQCKQWRSTKVGVNVVRELYGVMAAYGAAGGFVITSGTFTADARLFADGRNLQLLDGAFVASMIQKADAPAEILSSPRTVSALFVDRTIPHCPVCGVQMVQRVAKRGATVGQRFWGCAGFPKCRGTLPG